MTPGIKHAYKPVEQHEESIEDIIATIAPDEDLGGLNDTELLRDQIELDSMDFLDIVMELRKRYGVQVPEDDYKELGSLQSCADYLHPHLEDKVEAVSLRVDSPGRGTAASAAASFWRSCSEHVVQLR